MIKKDIQQLKEEVKRLKKELAISQLERQKFQRLAEYDFLTGIYNRHGFVRETERFLHELKAGRYYKQKRRATTVKNVSIIFVDMDDLKKMNDALGHDKGDRYIQAVAKVLVKQVRDIDVVGRWGGDEFVVALINALGDEPVNVANKLRDKIAKIRLANNCKGSASFGVISAIDSSGRARYGLLDLIEKADKAMYEAKVKHRKGVVVSFSDSME